MGVAVSSLLSRTWQTHTEAPEVRRSTGELAGAGRKILKRLFRTRLWPNDRPSRQGWFLKLLVRSAARIFPSLFLSVSEDEDSKSSNSVSSAEKVALKRDSEICSRDEAAHSMELLRPRTFDLSDDSGHATLNALGVKFCQKVSRPSEKQDIVDPIKNLRTPLPFRPMMPKRISFYHDGLVHRSQKCRPIVASERSGPSYVPTFSLPFSKRPLDLKGVSSTYQNLRGCSSKCARRNCRSIHKGGGCWSRFTGGSTVRPQSRRMAQKNPAEEITEEIEVGFSRPKPPMGASESKDPQEVFPGLSTSKSQNKDPSLPLQHLVCKAAVSDLFQVPKSQGHSQNDDPQNVLVFKPTKFGCTADGSRLFQVPKSQGYSHGEWMLKPIERAKVSDKRFGFAFPVSTTRKALHKREPMSAIRAAHTYLGRSCRESIIKLNEGVEVSCKGFIHDLLVSTGPKTCYKREPIPTLSPSQADSRVRTYQGHSCGQSVIKPNERVKVPDKGRCFDFLVSTDPEAFFERALMPRDSRAHTYQGHSCCESVIKPDERVEVSDTDFGFPVPTPPKIFYEQAPISTIAAPEADSRAHTYQANSCSESVIKPNEMLEVSDTIFDFPVPTAPEAFYERAPIATISSPQADSRADSRAHTFQGCSRSNTVFKPNERVDVSDKGFGIVFPVSTIPKALYESSPMHNISSSQSDSKEFPTSSDNVSQFTISVPLTSVHSEPPPTPQFKFGSKMKDNSSNERVNASDKGFDFAFSVSTAPKTVYEPAPIHAISSAQADDKVIPTSSDNDLDFSFPVPLALLCSEPPPTPQFKFGSMKRDSLSNEGVDAFDEGFDLAFSVSPAPKALSERAPIHTISSSQTNSMALPTSSDNDLDFTFPVSLALLPSEPPSTPQFKFGSKRRDSSSNERVDASDKDFDFAFPVSIAPKALYESTLMHTISSSQADALPTSSDNDLDFSFPVPLAPALSEPPPTPQFKFGYKKRDNSSNESVDAFDKSFDFPFHASPAPKVLYEPSPMHTISSSQANSEALTTSSENDLDFTFPVLGHFEPVTPQFKFGSNKRGDLSFKSVAESAICF